jgi:hypothetical protein
VLRPLLPDRVQRAPARCGVMLGRVRSPAEKGSRHLARVGSLAYSNATFRSILRHFRREAVQRKNAKKNGIFCVFPGFRAIDGIAFKTGSRLTQPSYPAIGCVKWPSGWGAIWDTGVSVHVTK